MSGDRGEVTIRRTAHGTPLLEAVDDRDAFFGLGYVQAADDIEGLLRQYLLVRGEISTADGTEGDAPDRDRNQRLWRVLDDAKDAYESLPTELRAHYDAFIAGVQTWMDEHADRVPVWAPPLDPWLPIGVNRTIMLYWVISDAVDALRVAGVDLPPVVSELARTPLLPGSNAWAIAPKLSLNGETFLVSDVHLPFGGAYTMHQATVVSANLHYTGFTFLGAMLPPLAHNADCAWGTTTGGPRVSDAYRLDEADVPPDAEAVELNGFRSPIIARQNGYAYAICSPYTGVAAETEKQLLLMVQSRSVFDLRAAFANDAFPPQNVIAADRHGDIAYLRTGRVPRRPDGAVGVLDVDQSWGGFLQQNELVQLVNPTAGYLQNCNSAPDTAAPELAASDWSTDAFNDLPGRHTSRSLRSVSLFSLAAEIDVDQVKAWAVEDLWIDTPEWQDALAAAAEADPARIASWPEQRRSQLDLLLAFDGHASPRSVAASAWVAWRTAIARTPCSAERLRELVDAFDPALLLEAFERSEIETRAYGDINRFPDGSPGRGGGFLMRPPAVGDTTFVEQVPLRATYFSDGLAIGGGPALRIVRFGTAGMSSWSVLLPSQAAVYSRGETLATPFDPEEVPVERRMMTEVDR